MPAPPLDLTARATVDRVVDGDTVDVSLRIPVRVRIRDCWAPEVRGEEKAAGELAAEHARKLLPVGSEVHVDVPTGDVDAMLGVLSFGRVLGQIWRPAEGQSFGDQMVADGFAKREKP